MILANIIDFVKGIIAWAKANLNTIILISLVVLFVLLSFATGYIIAKYQDRMPITINQSN